MPLTITSVEATPIALPLTKPIASALGTYTSVPGAAVWVRTSEGMDGFGFNLGLGGAVSRAVAAYINDELAPLAVGQDALAPEAVWNRMWAPNKARMHGGIGVWGLSAVDIAVWDIVGKAAGLPVNTLLGGHRQRVPVYGSGGWLSLSDTELVAECEAMAAIGIGSYKFKIKTLDHVGRAALLRRAMGDDFILLADANQGLTVAEAIEMSDRLSEYGVAWLEEPMLAEAVDDLAEVTAGSSVPIATGENNYFSWGFRHLCQRGVAYLQPDVARCGGIGEFRKIAGLAESYRVALSSHLWHELSISLVGASPSGWAAEYTTVLSPELWTRPFEVVDGHIDVPQVPGHGVELTAEALERFAL